MGWQPNREALYRAAVGPNADYYVPKFMRFEETGASQLSWNWPAFFVSFYWFLYRRMFANWGIFCIAIPVALVVIMSVVAQVTQTDAQLPTFAVSLFYSHLILPMYANAMYHRSIKKRIETVAAIRSDAAAQITELERAPRTSPLVYVLLPLFLVIVVGMLAGVALPAYQAFTMRTQVSEGLMLAAPVKALIAEKFAADKAWPATLADLKGSPTVVGANVADISVADGTISVHYGKGAGAPIAGHVLSVRPALDDHDEVIWNCGSAAPRGNEAPSGMAGPNITDIEPLYLPVGCGG